MLAVGRNHRLNLLIFAITCLLVLIGFLSLLRLLKAEFYILTLTCMSLTITLGMLRTTWLFILTTLTSYELICLSWALASNFQTLPRDDIYHYYPFTAYIYNTGHIGYHEGEVLERIFLGSITPWPAWHILQVSLAHMINIDLFYVVQIIQALTTAPLTILATLVLARALATIMFKPLNIDTLHFPRFFYLIVIFTSYSSLYSWTNTNPVSRSLSAILYLLVLYAILKLLYKKKLSWYIVISLIIFSNVFVHPYWSLSLPLWLILLSIITYLLANLLFIRRFKKYKLLHFNLTKSRYILAIGLAIFILAIVRILYYTHTARIELAKAFEILIRGNYQDVLGIRRVPPWLKTRELEYLFFEAHPLESLIYWLVWTTDFIPVVLAIYMLVKVVPLLVKGKVDVFIVILLSMLIAAAHVLIITGMASEGLVSKYALELNYPLIALLASIALFEIIQIRLPRIKNSLALIIVLLFVLTAGLSLGTRTYQASFIWSSTITFEAKGMHSTHAIPLMRFCNVYCDYYKFDYILSDDTITRIFIPLHVYIEFAKKESQRIPQSFMLVAEKNIDEALILSTRSFKPTYWQLRSLACWIMGSSVFKPLDLPKIISKAKHIILTSSNLVYQDSLNNRIYLFSK